MSQCCTLRLKLLPQDAQRNNNCVTVPADLGLRHLHAISSFLFDMVHIHQHICKKCYVLLTCSGLVKMD